jgi:hypothetical protein
MKYTLKFLSVIVMVTLYVSPYNLYSQSSSDYWAKNVALLDFRVRNVNETGYVREIVAFDFSKSQSLPDNFGYNDDAFYDDGKNYDKKAGDGIYTSRTLRQYNSSITFTGVDKTKSFIGKPIVDYDFQYEEQLRKIISPSTNAGPGIGISIKCKSKTCDCPQSCRCLACDWGMTTWCLDLYDCEIEVGVKFE